MGTPSFVLSGGQRPGKRGSRPWPGAPGRVPPAPAACGPLTLPTLCGGGAAARPACLRQSGKCGGWSPPAAAQAKPAASRCAGPPSPAARPSPCGAASRALPPASPAPVAALVLRGGPAPTMWGAVGPSAPPARAAALRPALPARPRLRRRPCRAALPTHSPPGVAALRGLRFGAPPARA